LSSLSSAASSGPVDAMDGVTELARNVDEGHLRRIVLPGERTDPKELLGRTHR